MATSLSAPALHELLLRSDVGYFAQHVLGAPYGNVKALIYPEPAYRAFLIRKKNGTPRLILEPRQRIKQLQLRALHFIACRAAGAKSCVHGFVAKRSIVTNARRHLESSPFYILNLDIQDFFPSITFYRVRGVFMKPPFNCSHEVATVLAHLCTYQGCS